MTARRRELLALALLSVACGEAEPGEAPATTFAADVIPLDVVAREGGPDAAPRPGPLQRRGAWAVALNEDCASCHADEAAAWRTSRHHHADTNQAYREAFAREPSAFCTSCHAPEARDPRSPTSAESALGVGCVSCHVVGDMSAYTVLSATAADAPSLAPHPVTRSVDFALTGGCAGCHEFRFPGRSGHGDGVFMQTTVRELEEAAGEGAACAACHMPRGDHGFAQVRDRAWLAAGLSVVTERVGEDVELVLSLPSPSHAFPTGDLFRRLEVGVEWRGRAQEVIERQTVHLARHFELEPGGGSGRTLVADDRIHLGERRICFERGEGSDPVAVKWWVTLQRVAEIGHGRDEALVMIESEQPIHEGVLEVPEGGADE